MQQHPVPQNISSYEFRLVGDMTLKQFFQLAGGILIAFVFYKTPLPGILKWPFMTISALTGVLLAFVPINGRPFSQWLLAFIRAIYSPTRFVWNSAKSSFVLDDVSPTETSTLPPIHTSPLDKMEAQLFSRFSDLLAGKNPFTATQNPTINTQPVVPIAQNPTIPPSINSDVVVQKPPSILQTDYVKMDITPPTPVPPSHSSPESIQPTPPSKSQSPTIDSPISIASTPLTPIASHSPVQATPSSSLITTTTIPTPEYPNILTGVINNHIGASVESAIIEITDTTTGIPVRALRTNKLGQFQIATPLSNGKYQVSIEKEGLSFETLIIEATGKIISPIVISATA